MESKRVISDSIRRSLRYRQTVVLKGVDGGLLCHREHIRHLAGTVGCLVGGFLHGRGDRGVARHVVECDHVVVGSSEFLHDILTAVEFVPGFRGLCGFGIGGHDQTLGRQILNLSVEPVEEFHGFGLVLAALERCDAGTTVRAGAGAIAEPVADLGDAPVTLAGVSCGVLE